MLKILIADDCKNVREGLKNLLLEEYPMALIEEAENGGMLMAKATSGHWDIVISDLYMPDMNGLEAIRRIKLHSPRLPVLITSLHSDDLYLSNSLKAGASGYLPKEMAPGKLADAIRMILSGSNYILEDL